MDATKFNDVLGRVGDIMLSNICTSTESETIKKYVLDVKLLAKVMTTSIMQLGNISSPTISSADASKMANFLDSISVAVDNFCDFLDYNRDGSIEIIKNQDGKISEGNDVTALLGDVRNITTAFKTQGNIGVTIIAVISKLTMFFTSNNFIHSKDEFNAFKTACETAYQAYSQIKSIDHKKIYEENASDMMQFVITMCVIAVPVIELLHQRILLLNSGDAIVTTDDIKKAVGDMYGTNLDFVLSIVNKLTGILLNFVVSSSTCKKIVMSFRSHCCSCCCSCCDVD